MSQHEFASQIEALNCENLQLLQHIDYLEERLSMYEKVPSVEESCAAARDESPSVDEWSVWPYSWATTAWRATSERFHSFHGRLHYAQLAKHNAHARRHHTAELEDAELTLM